MTRDFLRRCLIALLTLGSAIVLSASRPASAETRPVPIGYLELEGDPRYELPRSYAGIEVAPRHRPFEGAQVALRSGKFVGRALGLSFSLEKRRAENDAALLSAFDRLYDEQGVRYVLVDAPSDALSSLAAHAAARDALLFNVSERADALRAEKCAPNLMHTIPSDAMLADALVQFLKFKGWDNVLALVGPQPGDKTLLESFRKAARKFGLEITDTRDFVMGHDPREREKNNVALLTAGDDYDVVFIADSLGHFARLAAYQTAAPRPLVGSEGLMASAWHWTWERHGAPQLNQRFEKKAGRRMEPADWAAWVAVRAIIESFRATKGGDFKAVESFLKSDALTLDGYKGTPSTFRPWNNQLRQPILLHTHNAVIERAPLAGYLHARDYLDTLGVDQGASRCRF